MYNPVIHKDASLGSRSLPRPTSSSLAKQRLRSRSRSPGRSQLSLVLCPDFVEHPEGMREYGSNHGSPLHSPRPASPLMMPGKSRNSNQFNFRNNIASANNPLLPHAIARTRGTEVLRDTASLPCSPVFARLGATSRFTNVTRELSLPSSPNLPRIHVQDYDPNVVRSSRTVSGDRRRLSDCDNGPYLSTPGHQDSPAIKGKQKHISTWGFPGLAAQVCNVASSLPSHINYLSDNEDKTPNDLDLRSTKHSKRVAKLKRRKAYYNRPKRDGRSKSLTNLDAIGVGANDDMESSSETDNDLLDVNDNARRRRRKLSSAGKVSGTEFFTAVFQVWGEEWEDLVPATRGTCLREAISSVCERRGVDVDAIDVFLDNNKTPLPLLTSETSWLGGRTLKIRGKDESRSPVRGGGRGSITAPTSRKTSASYRGRQKFFNSLSVEEVGGVGEGSSSTPVSDATLKVTKGAKQANRWSGLWGTSHKDQKMEGLVIQLDNYSRLGIPKLQHLSVIPDPAEDQVEEALYSLEENWTDIVEKSASLSERIKAQQTALWELISTELAYIRTLKVIQDEARQSRQPLNPSIMRNGFTKVSELFSPYFKYCAEQTDCQHYCKEQDRDNQVFKAYLAWCETQRDCNRLRLIDILIRPMQRLTKYSLLLKAVLKKTDDVNQKRDLAEMDKNVESLVRDVNSHMRQRQEQERLKTIIARIDSYEPIETKDDELLGLLATSSHLDLTSPMPGCSGGQRRHLLMEGDLKMKEGSSSKVDVHCFLFTDMLLICKSLSKKGDRVKVIRQPYIVDRLVTVEVTRDSTTCLACVYLNEYKVATAAFTLHASENKLVRSWKDNLEKANSLYEEAKMASLSSMENILLTNYEEEMDYCGDGYLHAAPISRRNSRRSSRYSSTGHSHSGSMDLNDVSVASAKRDVSLELSDARASSFSSEDSVAVHVISKPRAASLDNRLLDTPCGGQSSFPSSPRNERRLTPHKLLSPNTLSVELSVEDDTPSQSTLSPVSARISSPLSPVRGISYPPLSPKSLKRSVAIQQQNLRNPPLIKSRTHVGSSAELSPSHCNVLTTGQPSGVTGVTGPAPPNITVIPDQGNDNDQETRMKRGARFEKHDTRRYHTAGTIEDLKKVDTKDSSIHKRLSWNQQPGGVASIPGNDLQQRMKLGQGVSSDSVQSSSGVSSHCSSGSLHLSIGSDLVPADTNHVLTIGHAAPQPATPPIPPRHNHHVSTTYITQNIDLGFQDSVTVHNPGLSGNRSETMSQTKTVHGTIQHQSPARVQGASFALGAKDPSKEKRLTSDKGSVSAMSQGGNMTTAAHDHPQPNPEIKINHHDAPGDTPAVHISIATTQGHKTPDSEQPTLREVLFKELHEAKF